MVFSYKKKLVLLLVFLSFSASFFSNENELNANLEGFYIQEAYIYFNQGDYNLTKELLDKAMVFGRQYSDTWYLSALILGNTTSETKQKRDYFRKAIDLDKWYGITQSQVHDHYIKALYDLGEYDVIAGKYADYVSDNAQEYILISLYEVGDFAVADGIALYLYNRSIEKRNIILLTGQYRSHFTSPFKNLDLSKMTILPEWSEEWLASQLASSLDERVVTHFLDLWPSSFPEDNTYYSLKTMYDLDWETSFNRMLKLEPTRNWDILVGVYNSLEPTLQPVFWRWLSQYSGQFFGNLSYDNIRSYEMVVKQGQIQEINYRRSDFSNIYFSLSKNILILNQEDVEYVYSFDTYPRLTSYEINGIDRQRDYLINIPEKITMPRIDTDKFFTVEELDKIQPLQEINVLEASYQNDEYIDGKLRYRYILFDGQPYFIFSDPDDKGYFSHEWVMRDWQILAGRIDNNGDGVYEFYEHYDNGLQDGLIYIDPIHNQLEYKSYWLNPVIKTWSEGLTGYLAAWQIEPRDGEVRAQQLERNQVRDNIIPWQVEEIQSYFELIPSLNR